MGYTESFLQILWYNQYVLSLYLSSVRNNTAAAYLSLHDANVIVAMIWEIRLYMYAMLRVKLDTEECKLISSKYYQICNFIYVLTLFGIILNLLSADTNKTDVLF